MSVRMQVLVLVVSGVRFDVRSLAGVCRARVSDPLTRVSSLNAKPRDYAFWRSLMGSYADFWQSTKAVLRYSPHRA